MKIHILVEFVDGPWGGGNQFLKALKTVFEKQGYYENDPVKANVILFNSHHNCNNVIRLKKKYPEKIFVHRIDGPMAYRGKNGVRLDKYIFYINSIIADGTVFQSEWSKKENYGYGMNKNNFETVIYNAPNPEIFFPSNNKINNNNKIKLIATSWSDNPNKGFDIYHYLDENIDFTQFEMTIVGRIDKEFKNIQVIDVLPSRDLAEKLRQHDIFIFASKIEACSNSLLEALHCGLPAVVRNTTSNPEILVDNGELFDGKKDILKKIDILVENYKKIRFDNLISLDQVAVEYKNFCENIILLNKSNHLSINKLSFIQQIRLKFRF